MTAPQVRAGRAGARWIAAACAVLAVVAGVHLAAAAATVVTDATGRRVEITDTRRIVSIGGSTTEILYALGLEDRIVAIDTTSLFPPQAARDKPNVGYMRALSAEGVLGLNPSLILAAEGSGPKETLAVLERARIPFVVVPDPYTGEGVVEKVRLIAQATGQQERGACLAGRVMRDLDSLARARREIARPLRVVFVLSLLHGRPMVAGANTAAEGIIALAGAANAITGYQGYKPVNDEAIIAAQPDAVLVMQRSQGSLDADSVFAHPAFAQTPAAARRAFVSMDGLYLLGFGPRTANAARELAHTLYPGVASLGPETAATQECR